MVIATIKDKSVEQKKELPILFFVFSHKVNIVRWKISEICWEIMLNLHEWELRVFSLSTFVFICIAHPHHHQIALTSQISLTLSHHPSLSSIAPGRSFRLHLVSIQSYAGIHKRTSLLSLSLLLQQCSSCLVCPTWMVCEMRGKWPYSYFLLGAASRICSRQHATFLYSFHLAFSLYNLLASI